MKIQRTRRVVQIIKGDRPPTRAQRLLHPSAELEVTTPSLMGYTGRAPMEKELGGIRTL